MKRAFLVLVATFGLAFGMITAPVTSVGSSTAQETTVFGQSTQGSRADNYSGFTVWLNKGSPLAMATRSFTAGRHALLPGQSRGGINTMWYSSGTTITWRYAGDVNNKVNKCNLPTMGCSIVLTGDARVLSVVHS